MFQKHFRMCSREVKQYFFFYFSIIFWNNAKIASNSVKMNQETPFEISSNYY